MSHLCHKDVIIVTRKSHHMSWHIISQSLVGIVSKVLQMVTYLFVIGALES